MVDASNEAITGQTPPASEDWSLRPWVLAGLLAIAGLGIHLASDSGQDVPWRMALTAFFFFGGGVAAFTLDRNYLIPPAIFAGIAGLVMAGIAWRATSAGDYYSDEAFWVAAGVLAVTLALPLFQSGFHTKRFKTSYSDAHYFVWTDAISGAGALAFVGLSWLVMVLLASLFELLQISLLSDLIDEQWFGWMFSGFSFGAALGVLRNQLKVLSTLKSVVLLVLSLLAVPLAVALVLFLLSMIVSGPTVLWEATRSATPILLGCAVGAFVLTNAVLRDDDEDMTKSRIQQWAALISALGIFPLTVFAAVSMGTRIAQHGLSPERLWALIAIVVATVFGVAYLAAFIRGRMTGWRDTLRQSNLHLAVLVSLVALVLAMPIFDFGAVSARAQLSRLANNVVSAEDFDYSALRWDFGEAGRKALTTLTKDENTLVAKLAKEAEEQEYRHSRYASVSDDELAKLKSNVTLVEDDPVIRAKFERYLREHSWMCDDPCVLIEVDDDRDDLRHFKLVSSNRVDPLLISESGRFENEQRRDWNTQPVPVTPDSDVEVRSYEGRRIYVDGKPVGAPFD